MSAFGLNLYPRLRNLQSPFGLTSEDPMQWEKLDQKNDMQRAMALVYNSTMGRSVNQNDEER